MEEIKAKDIMREYNNKYAEKVTLEEVEEYLRTHAFFAMSASLAAKIMHSDKI